TAGALAVPTEVDEATLTLFLGQETVRVLEAARAAAREIVSRSEADASARTAALDERVAEVEAELLRNQTEAEASVAALRAAAEEEVAKLRLDAEEATKSLLDVAGREAVQARESAQTDAASMRAAAEKAATELRSSAEADAARVRREVETEAAQVRNESAADALAAQDSAREQARLMLHEAQSVREKVLADLVKRRRAGRQQLDQVKAARDRLARSLAVVRKDLDEAMSELVASVPEARAAMEAVGRRVPDSVDARKAVALAAELDSVRDGGAPIVGVPSPIPDIDALFDRLRSGDSDPDASTDVVIEAPVAAEAAPAERDAPVADSVELELGPDVDLVGVEDADDDIDGVALIDGEPAGKEAVSADAMAQAARDRVATFEPVEVEPVEVEPAGVGVEEDGIDLPEAFFERDVTMTRFGPDLRRQLKRALADDQSLVLDGLRRVRNTVTVSDLPDTNDVLDGYAAAFSGPLRSAAENGARVVGGKVNTKAIDELIERVARSLAEPLRERVERAIERADGDKTEVLDPIRAHYRDARAVELPGIADDALAEAFALGVYHGLKDGTALVWVPDPRSEPGPDCFDNTLAGKIKKPAPFPTGHKAPLGSPGCRCLVLRG
ncbi:MAG: hypothetical protein O3C27_08470, partial [Actinomycetota bacterium]|nr:hypothetical protein [Actinomycetota bacterium]